ncbi:MAG: ABC transporter ATP-binding protein [Treponema sp.]|jgi:ABC-type Fe3+/spermidine/putrescine transport system ATPase subunit|nr:ABC transporter ATP-binding protein [Treponema sp.]
MALEVSNLIKSYPEFRVEVDFSVASGETLVLAGPSGCGKTTVLGLIAGLLRPDSGTIRIDGEDLTEVPPWKRDIGLVFQDPALFPHLSVGKNAAYGPFIRGMGREARRRLAETTLEAVHLAGYGVRSVDTLSGGERQRAAIARALAAAPRALLLDEPFSSLDAPLRRELRREFSSLIKAGSGAGRPVVFVTHDREEAAVIGGRIALMRGGKILESGPARELFLAPRTRFGAEFFGTGTVLPCMVEGPCLVEGPCRAEGPCPGGLRLSSPLGRLQVSVPPSGPPGGRPLGGPAGEAGNSAWLLVPRDAVSIGRDSGPNAAFSLNATFSLNALVKSAVFEGDRISLELELSGGYSLQAALSPRSEPPRRGERVLAAIDGSLLRLLR